MISHSVMTSIDYRRMLQEARAARKLSATATTSVMELDRHSMREPPQPPQLSDWAILEDHDAGFSGAALLLDFLSEEEELVLLRALNEHGWVDLTNRSLQNWGGIPSASKPMVVKPMPKLIDSLAKRVRQAVESTNGLLSALGGPTQPWKPQHALVNRYCHLKRQGIAEHKDGPLYHPLVGAVSCGAAAVFEFRRSAEDGKPMANDDRLILDFCIPPRSLLVFTGAAYTDFTHTVDSVRTQLPDPERCFGVEGQYLVHDQPRVSLTFRQVCDVIEDPLDDPLSFSAEGRREEARQIALHYRSIDEREKRESA